MMSKKIFCVLASTAIGLSSAIAQADYRNFVALSSFERAYFHPENKQYKKDLSDLITERAHLYCILHDKQELDISKIDQITLRDADANETLQFFNATGGLEEKKEELSNYWFFTDGRKPLGRDGFDWAVYYLNPKTALHPLRVGACLPVVGLVLSPFTGGISFGVGALAGLISVLPLSPSEMLVDSMRVLAKETGQIDLRHLGYKKGINRIKNGDQSVVKMFIDDAVVRYISTTYGYTYRPKPLHQVFTYVPCRDKPKAIEVESLRSARQQRSASSSRLQMSQVRQDPTIRDLYHLPQSEAVSPEELGTENAPQEITDSILLDAPIPGHLPLPLVPLRLSPPNEQETESDGSGHSEKERAEETLQMLSELPSVPQGAPIGTPRMKRAKNKVPALLEDQI